MDLTNKDIMKEVKDSVDIDGIKVVQNKVPIQTGYKGLSDYELTIKKEERSIELKDRKEKHREQIDKLKGVAVSLTKSKEKDIANECKLVTKIKSTSKITIRYIVDRIGAFLCWLLLPSMLKKLLGLRQSNNDFTDNKIFKLFITVLRLLLWISLLVFTMLGFVMFITIIVLVLMFIHIAYPVRVD